MKRNGLTIGTWGATLLFALSLYVAYSQATDYAVTAQSATAVLAAPAQSTLASLGSFGASLLETFVTLMNGLTSLFAGSLLAAVIVLALLVELVTLYSATNIQLKQKKIHLFHKKLVDRFHRGELTMGKAKRELDVLYSVNERIHRRGAVLVGFQLIVFVAVLWGLKMLSLNPSLLSGASSFNAALLAKPVSVYLPVLAALAYMLHALIKISVKQREDYISEKQVSFAIAFAIVASSVVFFFAGNYATLLSVYFLTQITFATMRYLIVDENARAWGKLAQRELIKMLRSSTVHKTKIEHVSRKFNHLAFARHFNFHLLEEAVSMSLAVVIALNGMAII